MNSQEFIKAEAAAGCQAHFHQGVWWKKSAPGVCRPVLPFQEVVPGEAKPIWIRSPVGYAHLTPKPLPGSRRVHYWFMSADRLNNFTLANLHYSVRKHVNRARRHGLRIERLESLDPYWSDLQAIAISKYERTSYGRPTTYYKENFDEWRASLLKEFLKPGRDWWGVFAENRLGGYLYGYRIENTQFLRVYKIHSDFLKLQASYLLYFSVLDYCRDLPGLVQVNAGRSGLTRGVDQFQQKQGFELKETFEYTHYNWAVKMILKKLKRLSPLAREDVGCSSKRLGRLQNLYQHALRMADRLDNGERY